MTRVYRPNFPFNFLDVLSFQARRSTEYIETLPANFFELLNDLLVRLFSARQIEIFNSRFRGCLTYREIAQEQGIAPARVGKILEFMCKTLARDENWDILTGRSSLSSVSEKVRMKPTSDLNAQLVRASQIPIYSVALGFPSYLATTLQNVGILTLADLLLCTGSELFYFPGLSQEDRFAIVSKLSAFGCSSMHLSYSSGKNSPYKDCPYAKQMLNPAMGTILYAKRYRISTISDFPPRAEAALAKLGVFTVAQLLQLSGNTFCSLSNIGPKSYDVIKKLLVDLGFPCEHLFDPYNTSSPYLARGTTEYASAFRCEQIPLACSNTFVRKRNQGFEYSERACVV